MSVPSKHKIKELNPVQIITEQKMEDMILPIDSKYENELKETKVVNIKIFLNQIIDLFRRREA